jgi:tetratricopeptide (TPR) repeat protein
MKVVKTIWLFVIVSTLLFAHSLHAQSPGDTDEQLAAQFYQNKEYDKAADVYEKLFSKSPTPAHYKNYLNCLLQLKEYKRAEKVIKKQVKQNQKNPVYLVDLGYLYQQAGEAGDAKKEYERSIKQLTAEGNQAFDLANAFVAIKQYDYAIDVYNKARKLLDNAYPFNVEIAGVYALKGDALAMVNEYLDLLLQNDAFIETVQNSLQPSFGEGSDASKNEIIKAELLKRIQRYPEKTIFSELLIWMQVQQQDYEGAFIQAKALDKRLHEDGLRIMNLGQTAFLNEKYNTAIKCYQYVISKGNNTYYYVTARMELLNVMYKKVIGTNTYTKADLLELEKNYQLAITEIGKQASTALLIKNVAHLQAFYLQKTDEARQLLEQALALAGISEQVKAECKLELADVLLMQGEVWDASLLYSQTEKSFKNDLIGQEAKFRNARLSYYIADFKWAQAQLNVLKAATTKLIANDAMGLSLMISDNLAIDTNEIPLGMFARADLLVFQNEDSRALLTLDSITRQYPTHSLADDIAYKHYQIKLKEGKYTEAASYLTTIITSYGTDLLADDALFNLGDLYETYLNDKEKAKTTYEQLITKHPDSLFVVEARKRFRRLRGDVIN